MPATLTELPISSISFAARASSSDTCGHLHVLQLTLLHQLLRELEQAQRGAARQDVIELRMHEHVVVGHEGDVHVGALADVSRRDR